MIVKCYQFYQVMLKSDTGIGIIPELYAVPAENVVEEYTNPGSQDRIPIGSCPFMWAQSLYLIGKLIQEVRSIL